MVPEMWRRMKRVAALPGRVASEQTARSIPNRTATRWVVSTGAMVPYVIRIHALHFLRALADLMLLMAQGEDF